MIALFYAGTLCSEFGKTVTAGAVQTGAVSVVSLLLPTYLISVALTWMSFDARISHRFVPHGLYVVAVAALPLVLPLYLIWSRGFKGVGLCVLHGIGLMMMATLGYHLAGVAMYGFDAWFAQFS